MAHTLGAVQSSAPHTSGAGHCVDEQDIMCYADGGPNQGLLSTVCNVGASPFDFAELFDCNQDDYFDPTPAPGSYLATHWNTFDSIYLCAPAKCDTVIAAPAVSLSAPSSAFRGNTLSLTANATGATIERYEWDLNNDGVFERDTGTTNSTSQQLTANGTKTVRVRATTADGTFGLDTRSVTVSDPATPTPAFAITSGTPVAGQPVTFDATGTTDPDGVITNFKWDFDGNGAMDLDAGLTRTASTTFASAGSKTVVLEVDYPLGFSTITKTFTVGAGTGTPTQQPTQQPTTQQPTVTGPSFAATASKLAKLLKRGLVLKVACGAACAMSAKLTVSAATAKKLGLKGKRGKPVKIGSLKRTLPAAGILTTQIVLTNAARSALARIRSVAMTLTAKVTQPGFGPLSVKRALTIKR
jgi:hypothetical protein